MDRLVRMFHGGSVKEDGEFEKMNEQVELFDSPPSLNDVVQRVISTHGCRADDVKLRGRFDCGKARSHYVLMDLSSDSHWRQYKEIVAGANVGCYEVAVDICRRTQSSAEEVYRLEAEHIAVENLTQQSNVSHLDEAPLDNNVGIERFCNDHPFDMARAVDDFDPGVFEQEENEHDDDDISTGSEGGGDEDDDEEEEDEEFETNGCSPIENVVELPNEVEEADGDNEGHVDVGSVPIVPPIVEDRFAYTPREIALLRQVDAVIPAVANDRDISMCDKAVCQFEIPTWEATQDIENPTIMKGMRFSSFEEMQYFLADYAVKKFRPFYVIHSDRNLRYEVACKQGCLWRVWARFVKSTGQWKISRVVQPHTCRTAVAKQVHSQLTARYLSRRILAIVMKDNDTSIPSLIESIFAFSSYRVKYSKAWRAKQHAIAMLWGDWAESYGHVPRVLQAMAHFNPGVKWFPYTTGLMQSPNGVLKHVLHRVFWCFPQCLLAFQRCRPVILVDGTFLTGKYQGTLMMAVSVDAESQIVPLAFAVVESENLESWSWFMKLV